MGGVFLRRGDLVYRQAEADQKREAFPTARSVLLT